MSERRRFYEALSWLVYTEDWGGLEYIEDALEHKRGEILAQFLAQHDCKNCLAPCAQKGRSFEIAFGQKTSRVIE